MTIHPSAVVDPSAELADDVSVGPFAVIEADVRIGSGTSVGPHVSIRRYTSIGERCQIDAGAALGGLPQDAKFRGEPTSLIVGDDNLIREYVTLHRATGEGSATVIGSGNFIMAYSHVGHNSVIGSNCLIASYVGISGHCHVEDRVNIGGMVGIHQFITIGRLAMVAGVSGLTRDVPPFTICEGRPARPRAINVIGLRRNGVNGEGIAALKQTFKLVYASGLNVAEGLARAEREVAATPEVTAFIEFHQQRDEGARGRRLNP